MTDHLTEARRKLYIAGPMTSIDDYLDLAAERDALAAKVERVRALHYAADNDGPLTPRCPDCEGKAGANPCGCWAPQDRQPVCGECSKSYRGHSMPWPCPTIRALEESEADR